MKTKKRSSSASSRFTRGEKVSKSSVSRRHARKSPSSHRKSSMSKEGFVSKLEDLTPL